MQGVQAGDGHLEEPICVDRPGIEKVSHRGNERVRGDIKGSELSLAFGAAAHVLFEQRVAQFHVRPEDQVADFDPCRTRGGGHSELRCLRDDADSCRFIGSAITALGRASGPISE